MKTSDLQRQLTDLGQTATPMPRAEFADALEERLHHLAPTQGDYVRAPEVVPPRNRRPSLVGKWRAAIVPALAALLACGVGAYAVVGGDPPRPELAATADVSTTALTTTLAAPESTVAVATTVTTVTATAPTTTPTTVATTTVPVTRPTTTAAPVEPKTTTTTTRKADSTTTSTAPTTTVGQLRLTAARVETSDTIALQWTEVAGAAKYALVRTTATGGAIPPEPFYPAAPPSTLVTLTTALGYNDTVAAPITGVRYRVVALGPGGTVLAQSVPVAVEMPR